MRPKDAAKQFGAKGANVGADFEGKTMIVTGGAAGIGAEISVAAATAGANVLIVDIDSEAGGETLERVADSPGRGSFHRADLGVTDESRAAVLAAVAEFGSVDCLVNNVGIQPVEAYLNVEATTEEMWDRILTVNLKSYFLMAKHAIPEIRKRGGGSIVNIASVQGLQSQPLVPAYAASKGGVLSLTRQMSLDYAAEAIRVNAVNPGITDSRLVRRAAALEEGEVEEVLSQWGHSQPIGRICTGQDIAAAVLFLASDAAAAITGEHLTVDGGMMALGAWASAAGAGALED